MADLKVVFPVRPNPANDSSCHPILSGDLSCQSVPCLVTESTLELAKDTSFKVVFGGYDIEVCDIEWSILQKSIDLWLVYQVRILFWQLLKHFLNFLPNACLDFVHRIWNDSLIPQVADKLSFKHFLRIEETENEPHGLPLVEITHDCTH